MQRLSVDVTGKVQKYLRIRPRKFVQVGFDNDELTIEKIKGACLKHFAPQTGRNVVCDVLAGEQGLSCSNIKQVSDLKLTSVRFISDSVHVLPGQMWRIARFLPRWKSEAPERDNMKTVCPTQKSSEEHSLFPVLRKRLCISLCLQKVFPLCKC